MPWVIVLPVVAVLIIATFVAVRLVRQRTGSEHPTISTRDQPGTFANTASIAAETQIPGNDGKLGLFGQRDQMHAGGADPTVYRKNRH